MLQRFQKEDRQFIPRVGTIRLGIKVKKRDGNTGKEVEYPKATDYFVIKGETQFEKELLQKAGEKPKELRIYFPFIPLFGVTNKKEYFEKWLARVFPVHYKVYAAGVKGKGGQLVFKADDQKAVIHTREYYKKIFGKEAPPEDPPYELTLPVGNTIEDVPEINALIKNGTIKAIGILNFNVVGIDTPGTFQMTCKEAAIQTVFNYLNSLWISPGVPFNIETILSLQEITVSPKGEKKVIRIIKLQRAEGWENTLKALTEAQKIKTESVNDYISQLYGVGKVDNILTAPSVEIEHAQKVSTVEDDSADPEDTEDPEIVDEKTGEILSPATAEEVPFDKEEDPPAKIVMITAAQLKLIHAACRDLGVDYKDIKDKVGVDSVAKEKCTFDEAEKVISFLADEQTKRENRPGTVEDLENIMGVKPKPENDAAYVRRRMAEAAAIIQQKEIPIKFISEGKQKHGIAPGIVITREMIDNFITDLSTHGN